MKTVFFYLNARFWLQYLSAHTPTWLAKKCFLFFFFGAQFTKNANERLLILFGIKTPLYFVKREFFFEL